MSSNPLRQTLRGVLGGPAPVRLTDTFDLRLVVARLHAEAQDRVAELRHRPSAEASLGPVAFLASDDFDDDLRLLAVVDEHDSRLVPHRVPQVADGIATPLLFLRQRA